MYNSGSIEKTDIIFYKWENVVFKYEKKALDENLGVKFQCYLIDFLKYKTQYILELDG